MTTQYKLSELLYDNPLACPGDIDGWRMEGDAAVTFPCGRMRMENLRDASEQQAANFVHWCPADLPSDLAVRWDFTPIREPGLCILFFAAAGRNGEDLFDPALAKRVGPYDQYHHGDINAYHVSYFRRRYPKERGFHTCNLRKSYGRHMVARGPDPIPSVADATPPYHIRLVKLGALIELFIDDLKVLRWTDDGRTYGPVLAGGKIGFRQMAPLMAEYADLTVHAVEAAEKQA